MSGEAPGVGDLIGRVVEEAVGLIQAELARARVEIDERTKHGVQLLVRGGITLVFAALALQAFSIAAIVWSASVFGGYTVGALVVGTVFLAIAGAGGLAVRRAAVLTAEPSPRLLPAPEETRSE